MRTCADMTDEELKEHKKRVEAFLYFARALPDISKELIEEDFMFNEEIESVKKMTGVVRLTRNRLEWRFFSILAEEWSRERKREEEA